MIAWLLLSCASAPAPERPPEPVLDVEFYPTIEEEPTVRFETVAGDTGPVPVFGPCRVALTCGAAIPDEPKIPCHLLVVDDRGRTGWDGPAGVELRGRSSLGFPKHQYNVELWDEAGASVSADLLGMGGEADWVLNGSYIDRAMLRNKLAYDLFQSWGGTERYAPESASCTLALDGEELGIFFLVERIGQDDDRIPIADDPAGGSFVVKLEDAGGIVDNTPVGFGTWDVVSPADPDPAQLTGIRDTLLGWQAALLSDDPASVFAWVDRESAVDLVLLEELFKNNDAYYLSIHAWKEPGGLLRFTPWDLDLSLGQPTYNNNVVPEEWVLYRPTMIARMGDDPGFGARLAERWRELRATTLTDAALLARVDADRAVLGDALYANYEIWSWNDIYLYWGTLPIVSDVDEEYAQIRAWIPARTAWIDANIDAW